MEEIHWKQRGRVNWLNHGDRNTKFFHSAASALRNTNKIQGLRNPNGDWCTEEQDLPVVRPQMNEDLSKPFTAEEVRKATFDMHPSKAPEPDGFTALFYQILWPIIGNDITSAALSILNDQ